MFYDSRCKYFDISIILELHFLLVRTSFNHILANFEKKKKNFAKLQASGNQVKMLPFLFFFSTSSRCVSN